MYSKTTKKINITVKPYYLEDQSEPEDQHYVWAYNVTIDNQGNEKVQLVNRHWKIIDANGTLQEVRGKGVVGEQPVLKPGEKFEYTNGIEPKIDITNQDEIVNKNACLIPSLIFFVLNEKYKIIPIKNVIRLE